MPEKLGITPLAIVEVIAPSAATGYDPTLPITLVNFAKKLAVKKELINTSIGFLIP